MKAARRKRRFQRKYYDEYKKPRNMRNLRWYLKKRGGKILENIRIKPGIKILDVGCGDGIFASFFKTSLRGEFHYVGTDISLERCISGKKENDGEDFIQSQAASLPFREETFDLVFANGLLHHVYDYRGVLQEMWRVCRENGNIILIEPNRLFPGFTVDALIRRLERGILRVSPGKVVRSLSDQGGLSRWQYLPVNTYTFPYRSFPPAFLFRFIRYLENLLEIPFISTNFMILAEKSSDGVETKEKGEGIGTKSPAIFLRSIISFLLAFLIVYRIGWGKIAGVFSSVDFKYLLLAFCFTLPSVMLKTVKWLIVLRRGLPDARWQKALKSLLFGYAVGAISPGRIGEIARILFFKRDRRHGIAGLVIVDKVLDFLALIFLSTIGVIYFFNAGFIVLPVALSVLGIYFLSCPLKSKPILEKALLVMPFKEKIRKLLESYHMLSASAVLLCFGIAVLGFILNMFQFYFLVTAFNVVSVKAIAVSLPLIVLSNVVPVGIGNIGVREMVAALILANFQLPNEVSVSSAFVLFLMDIVIPGIVGVLFLPALRRIK